jgi:class 3 adenylate cyclase/tetratricopeptide (TPR) repeat protein
VTAGPPAEDPGATSALSCASCGAPLSPEDTRCPACGEPVASGERKVVTLLFADLTGYTAIASSMDPEDVYTFLRPTMTALRLVVEGFGGTVPQLSGDGFMAVFGAPTAHEDDPERAARSALALIDRIRELRLGGRGIPPPQVRVGVNTGEVMVAGSREEAGFAVHGDAVNVAARLMGLAEPGRALVGERTQELSRHAIRYAPRRLRRVKGKPELVPTYEALSVATAAPMGSVPPPRSTAFVGRGPALRRLSHELEAARAHGRSRVILVTGEAGIGKSRLASEFASGLRGVTVMTGRSPPYGERLPYQAFADGIRDLARISGKPSREQEETAIKRLARRLGGRATAGLVSHLRFLLGLEDRPASASWPGEEGRVAVRAVVEAAARRGPLLVVLDDLHWAGPEMLDALREASESPWTGPILILGVARPAPTAALRTVRRVSLTALGRGEVRAIIDMMLGPVEPASVSDKLIERCGGNPLFLEESIRLLIESGALTSNGAWKLSDPAALARVPATLRLLIAARIDGLPPEEKRLLQTASVAGEETWEALVQEMAGLPTAGRGLRRLQARDLLRKSPRTTVPGTTQYGFKHGLIRDVAYASVPRAERAAGHLQVAGWLTRATDRLPAEPLADLAHHYERAWDLARSRTGPGPSPDTVRLAARYLRRWGDQVLAYQPRLAESAYARGLRIAKTADAVVRSDLMAELLIARAEALVDLGRHREALEDAHEAELMVSGSDAAELLPRALLVLGRAESDLGRVRTARKLLQRALDRFEGAGDLRGQARALHRLAETCRFDDLPAEVDFYRRAHALYARVGDVGDQAVIAQDLAYLLTVEGGPRFQQAYEEARGLAEGSGDARSRASLSRTWGYYALYRGDHEEALRAARSARPFAVEVGDRWVEVDSLLLEALAMGAAGPPEEAERLAGEVISIARQVGARRLAALALLAAVRPALRSGKPALARSRSRMARRVLEEIGASLELVEAELADAFLDLDRGAWSRATAAAERAESRARASGWSLYEPLGSLLTGRAHLGEGRLDEAKEELARARRTARSVGASGTASLAEAASAQARALLGERPRAAKRSSNAEVIAMWAETEGLLAAGAEDYSNADGAFDRAVQSWESLGMTVWLARALALRAGTLRRLRRVRVAERTLERAIEVMGRIKSPANTVRAVVGLAGDQNRPARTVSRQARAERRSSA